MSSTRHHLVPDLSPPPRTDGRVSPFASAPLAVAGAYLVFGLAWVWLTDLSVVWMNSWDWRGFWPSGLKGSLFVLVSSVLIHRLVLRHHRAADRSSALLRSREAFTRDVLNSVSAHIAVLAPDGEILSVNAAWQAFAAGNPESEGPAQRTGVGTNYLGVCDESAGRGCVDAAAAADGIRRVCDGTADRFAFEYPCHSPDEKRWFAMSVTRLVDSPRVVVTHTNITERRVAEEETRRAHDVLQLVLDNIPQGVFWKDRDSRFMGCNLLVARSMGLSTPGEIVGLTHSDLPSITPDQAAQFVRKDREVMDAGLPLHHIIEPMTLADGQTIWLDTNKVPMRDAGGQVVGVLGTWEDVSNRIRDEEARRFQHSLLKCQAEASPDGILVVGPDNRVRSYNRRFLELWGIPESLAAAGDDTPILALARSRTADPDGFAARVAAIYAEPEVRTHDEVALADGRTLERYSGPILAEGGEWLGRVWFFRDITDRLRAEESVRASEALFRGAFEDTNVAMVLTDVDNRFVRVNAAFGRLFGYSAGEMVGMTMMQITHPDDVAASLALRARLVAGESHFAQRKRYVHRDGRVLWGLTNVSLVRDSDGHPQAYIGEVQDITAQQRAEEELRASEARLRLFVEHAPTPIAMFDREMRYLHVSRRWMTDFGLGDRDVIGLSHYDVFPEVPERWKEVHRRCLAGAVERSDEDHFERTDGTIQWIRWEVRPWTQDDGVIGGIIFFSEDITERKQAESALRRAKERYRLAQEAGRVGIYDWDGASGQSVWTPEQQEIYGLSAGEFGGRHEEWIDHLHPLDRDRVLAHLNQVTGERREYTEIEYRIVRPSGEARWVSNRGRMTYGPEGQLTRSIGTTIDITDRKQAEHAIQDRERLLRIVTDSARVGLVVVDDQYRYLFANRAYAEFFGLTADGVVGRRMPELLAPVWSQIQPRLDRTLAGERLGFELQFPATDGGESRWFRAMYEPLTDEAVKPTAVLVVSEITAQKLTTQSLQDRERLLSIVTGSARVGLVVVNGRYEYLFANEAYAELFGFPATAIVGRRVPDLLAAGWAQIRPQLDRALAGERVEYELTIPGPEGSGSVRTFRVMYEPGAEDSETPTVVVVVTDVTEQKRAEVAIRESEARFRRVYEHAATGIGITDTAGRFHQCNPAYCAILGRTEDELRAADLPALIHPDDRDENMTLLRRLAAGEIQGYELENRFLHKSGTQRWVHKFVTALRNQEGRATHLIALVTDVTERHRAEQELRESEDRYRRLVDVLPAAVLIHSDGRVVFCNPAFLRFVGAAAVEDVLGSDPFGFAHPDFHPDIRARMAEMAATGRAVSGMELQLVRRNGRPVPVYSVSTPLSFRGRPATLIALTDLTERNRTTDLLRTVLGSVADAIITLDEDGTVRSINPATERLFGYPPSEIVGEHVGVLLPEHYRGRSGGHIAAHIRTGGGSVVGIDREDTGRRKDGTTFPVDMTVTEFWLDGKRHFTKVIRDVTTRKQLEAQFRQAQKMEAVGRLAGGIAHDFNNLLTVINGYGDLLLMDLPPGTSQRESVSAMREAGERAARLTQQLLAFSRKAVVEPRILDVNDVVAQAERLLRRLIGEDVVLTFDPDPALPRVLIDPGQLEQVVMNLVVNARDAMPTGGTVAIRTVGVEVGPDDSPRYDGLKPGRYARVTVADTGHGMPDEVKAKLFEPFFTTKGIGKGTGLGLSVVHGVVQQCGGWVGFESQSGAGTTFELLFPAADTSASLAAAAPAGGGRAGGSETVLLVEDELAVRRIARLALQAQGYTVLEASSGAEAERVASAHPERIDLLLTDVVMPGMGGPELASKLREKRPRLRVLYMSGYLDDAIVEHGVRVTETLISKPFSPIGLARRVRAVLDSTNS